MAKTSTPEMIIIRASKGQRRMISNLGKAAGAVDLLIVGAFAAFVAFAGLWALPPLDRDEARFAQATAQMLETGDYVAIRFQDKERNKKPAGIHWLQAASVAVFSDVEKREIWAYRVPSLFGVVFAALFTYLAAERLYDQRTAFLAGLLIASAPLVAAEATIAKTDGVLLALVCLAQYAFIEIYARVHEGRPKTWAWPLIFWTTQAGAVLVKGPIAPLISLLTGLGLTTGRPRIGWVWSMRPVSGLLILILLTAPWLIAIGLATEGRFFADAIGGDMLAKVGKAQESHSGPPGYHAGLVWFLFWPAAALLTAGLAHIWRDRGGWQARFLLAWLVPAWLFFEFSATKLPHYVLPLYPALAIIAAHAAVKDGVVQTPLRKMGAVIYAGVGLVGAGLIAALPVVFSEAPLTPLCFAASALVAGASLLIARLFWVGRAFSGGVCAAILSALYAWTVMTGVLPGLSKLAISPRLSTALETLDRHPLHNDAGPVAMAGYYEPSAVFLLGTNTVLTSGAHAAHLLLENDVSAAIVESREEEYFFSIIGHEQGDIRPLAVIDGVNYSNGKRVSLKIYAREQPD